LQQATECINAEADGLDAVKAEKAKDLEPPAPEALPKSAPPVAGDPCPKCVTGMLVEKNRKNDGGAFLGCSRYPDCK
jgi:ssDNA-binding Zn-finger/Zn-ribbon topoisomerase 1